MTPFWKKGLGWKKSLAGQFIAFLLLALVAAQALTMLITWDGQQKTLKEMAQAEFIGRTATLARLVETMPHDLRAQVLAAGGTSFTRFWTTPADPVDTAAFRQEAIRQLEAPLPSVVALSDSGYPKFAQGGEFEQALRVDLSPVRAAQASEGWHTVDPEARTLPMSAKYVQLAPAYGMGIAVPLSDGTWLNSAYYKAYPSRFWNAQTLLSIGLTALLLSLLGVATARRIARPLRQLAHSAEALGRGEVVEVLPECGPDDIRRTCEAFNRMQGRLTRFVSDRTRMLAAISHDIRTPLTSLRLRAEFVGDEALKRKMLASIDEMQTMTEATLAFVKNEAAVEETRAVELCSLVESICEDMVEIGREVEFRQGDKLSYRCRPDALRRAVRNLIENAVRYGGRAEVSLRTKPANVEIVVADSGPGIPEEMRENVFSPFFRLESSRCRETGGAGLGLSIARAIARHHGGDIVLRDNDPGLQAVLILPRGAADGSRNSEAGKERKSAARAPRFRLPVPGHPEPSA